MADAGLKISTAALGLTFAVMLAANVVPTSAARLWHLNQIGMSQTVQLYLRCMDLTGKRYIQKAIRTYLH